MEMIKTGITLVATEGVKELVKTCINSYIKPKLDKYYQNTELEKKFELFEENIQEYMERSYDNALYLNTIVFNNEKKNINDLYIPLTVAKYESMNEDRTQEIYMDKYKEELIDKYKRVLLVDGAGMGKSTLLKFIYLRVITENRGIPILIELRDLEKEETIIECILKEMNGIKTYFEKDQILELIQGGDFIFLFDGYDEIAQELKENTTKKLQEFISKSPNNLFVMSSRDENGLNCFGNFQRFIIKSLSKEEAYNLIKKYDKDNELSRELISKLETESNLEIIKEFLENPLMVSLLYKAFEYKKTIPYKKDIFYRQVYNALFEEHDLSKLGAFKREKLSNLDIEDFHRVLRFFAFRSLAKGIIYTKEEFVAMINESKKRNIDIEFNTNNFIYDVTHSVPIFVKDGIKYRWAHKSFQEYFAANYIRYDAKDNQTLYLKSISEEFRIEKYYNVLDFYYDIDYKGFLRTIIYPILNDYCTFWNNDYSSKLYIDYNQEDIQKRKTIKYIMKDAIIKILTEEDSEYCEENDLNGKELFEYAFGKLSKFQSGLLLEKSIGFLYNKKSNSILLKLLYNKNNDIVKNLSSYHRIDVEELRRNIGFGEHILNDDIDNPLNGKECFRQINDFWVSSDNRLLVLDYTNCMELKQKIEEDIENEANEAIFL